MGLGWRRASRDGRVGIRAGDERDTLGGQRVITICGGTLSPLALQILQTYRDMILVPDVHDPGQIVQDMYQSQPEYVATVMELLRTAVDRCRLVVIIENVGDALYSD